MLRSVILIGLVLFLNIFEQGNMLCSSLRLQMASVMTPSSTTPREFRNLKALPCTGSYKADAEVNYPSFYLSPTKLTVQERKDGKMITRGLVPIPVNEEVEPAVVAAMKSSIQERTGMSRSWSGQLITDRNGGLYDALTKTFIWSKKPYARKEIYESLRLRGSCASPYHGLVDAINQFADLEIRGLLVELADTPDASTASLGAAILVAKKEYASNWKLSFSNTDAIQKVRGSDEAQLVKCTMDELFGIALVCEKLPVVISNSLYDSVNMAGLMQKTENSQRISVSAPYFSSRREQLAWEAEVARQQELEVSRRKNPKKVLEINQIRDATSFLELKTSEKRAILRQSGLAELPRPREGPRAVDAIMIPLLDEEVAYEVLRRLAETRGNFKEAAMMQDFESRKPLIARQVNEARRRGDREEEARLCDELNSLSTLRFDPTNPDGVVSKDSGFDVEEWYWEQRKRVYGIIAA